MSKRPSKPLNPRAAADVVDAGRTTSKRSSAEAELRELVVKFAADHLRLVNAARRRLRKRLPTAFEVVYEYRDFCVISFSPGERGYEGVFAIRASGAGVKLYFNRGKELTDPNKLLRGSGGLVRSIDLEGESTLNRAEIVDLIDEAVARNPLPFKKTGGRSIVFRPPSAAKRKRRA
jgi:hypothetical protein